MRNRNETLLPVKAGVEIQAGLTPNKKYLACLKVRNSIFEFHCKVYIKSYRSFNNLIIFICNFYYQILELHLIPKKYKNFHL